MNSQSFRINGFVWDTIYNLDDNKIELNGFECNKIKYRVQPDARIRLEGCILSIYPYHIDTTYQITINSDDKKQFVIKLYSQRGTVKVLSIANKLISTESETIPLQLAKQLRGVRAVVDCPWLRDACKILGYSFMLKKGNEIVYIEEISNWQLSGKAKTELQSARQGTAIIFEHIHTKCPGDDAEGFSDIKFIIK